MTQPNWLQKKLDDFTQSASRSVAHKSSRRGFFGRFGGALVGVASIPLFAIDGYLCSCCGGSHNTCPPGTEMSPLTWIGTCRNPADNRNYIVSYNDCCGKSDCGRCLCNRNEGDKPVYRPQANNDIDWCLGTTTNVYNCSTAVVIGVAT